MMQFLCLSRCAQSSETCLAPTLRTTSHSTVSFMKLETIQDVIVLRLKSLGFERRDCRFGSVVVSATYRSMFFRVFKRCRSVGTGVSTGTRCAVTCAVRMLRKQRV